MAVPDISLDVKKITLPNGREITPATYYIKDEEYGRIFELTNFKDDSNAKNKIFGRKDICTLCEREETKGSVLTPTCASNFRRCECYYCKDCSEYLNQRKQQHLFALPACACQFMVSVVRHKRKYEITRILSHNLFSHGFVSA